MWIKDALLRDGAQHVSYGYDAPFRIMGTHQVLSMVMIFWVWLVHF